MSLIDAAALDSARGKPGLEATVERFRFFNEVLEGTSDGEEELPAIFPMSVHRRSRRPTRKTTGPSTLRSSR